MSTHPRAAPPRQARPPALLPVTDRHARYSNTITYKAAALKIPFEFPDLYRRKVPNRRQSLMNKTLQKLSRFWATVAIATGRGGAMF
jgi:alkylhydroperoxidase/carboxymuconolactone decarboxylase family protein YurZ